MIKLENYEVLGWEHAIRGMRNPMNSWEKSDTTDGCINGLCGSCGFNINWCGCTPRLIIGSNDHDLMMRLAGAGPVHGKFRRMITVYVDITAPLYWWKEFDTYKVGTVANSCSTMHKLPDKEFELSDFSHEHLRSGLPGKDGNGITVVLPGASENFENTLIVLNRLRDIYLYGFEGTNGWHQKIEPKSKDIWYQMIQLLPSSYNQKRTVQLNYEVLANMYEYRKAHKLDEWREFCKWIETLPYSEIITGGKSDD